MLAQIIFNNLLLASTKHKSIKHKLLILCRKFLLLFGEVNVEFKYHKYSLQIPFSHDLPLNMKMFPTYNVNLGKITKIVQQKYADLKVIDVGANIGDSVAVMHHEAVVPILCIEGNPKFLKLLEQNAKQFKDIEIEASFVGEKSVKVNPQNNLGTAFLEESNEGIMVHTMQEVISKHPKFATAKLLKIDTDGFDNIIIRASKELLSNAKPVIFFEYDPFYLAKQNEKGIDIFDFLEVLNYTSAIVFDNFGFYLTTVSLSNKNLLKDLHHYFNRNGSIYMDICVVHKDDVDLLERIK
ncbi:MAG: FkbM family methyltransferase [Bacteroidota bacterium]